jgi:cytochrome c553
MMNRLWRAAWLPILLAGAVCATETRAAAADSDVPDWLYPANTAPRSEPAADPAKVLRLEGSRKSFTREQLGNLYSAPDWYPDSHVPMPDVVEHGRSPKLYACGYCHGPTGQGRPENAALAGLPVAYIVRQVHAMKIDKRHAAWTDRYIPTDLMLQSAQEVGENELLRAAGYFAMQTLRSRVRVVEAAKVPRHEVVGLVYAALPGAGDEPLGERLLEFAPDPKRHELRDEKLRYVAYAPTGSVARGRKLAHEGAGGAANACMACHGKDLKGVGSVPPIAGRSPTYLLRSLYAYRLGARTSDYAAPMRPVAAALTPAQMIDAAAYCASLEP